MPFDKDWHEYYNVYIIILDWCFMIKVYLINIRQDFSPEMYFSHFPDRVERAKRFLHNDDALRSYAAGVLVWRVLSLEDKDILFGENAKPYSEKTNLHYNISHSGDYVALAVDENEVGVDIEFPRPSSLRVSKKVFTEAEQNWMKLDELRNFTCLWTLKESVMKLLGTGLALPANSFDVMPLVEGRSIIVDSNEIYACSKFYSDYSISVCSRSLVNDFDILLL